MPAPNPPASLLPARREARLALATLGLGPLLLAQGWRARRRIPQLPEPAGPRQGQRGLGPALRLLILGDSAAAGVGADHQEDALSGQLVAALATEFRVDWQLTACTGHTTAEVLQHLMGIATETFDVAVLSVGVNDATRGHGTTSWLAQLDRLLHRLQHAHHVRHVLISALPPMQLFPALPQPLRWYMGRRAEAYNQALQQHLHGRSGCTMTRAEYPPDPGLVASDGFHPGPAAYRHWAEQLAIQIRHAHSEAFGGIAQGAIQSSSGCK